MGIAADRLFLAKKLWRFHLSGWSAPHWKLTQKDQKIIEYWTKQNHIETDGQMMRLTDAGRLALQDKPAESAPKP